jgi:uncharacterized protein (UPF0303 family)
MWLRSVANRDTDAMSDDIWAGITLAGLAAEEAELHFPHFTYDDAWQIGTGLVETARERSLPITIDITRGGQQLFHAALAGSTPDNDVWIQRKIRAVLRFSCSSLTLSLKARQDDVPFAQARELDGLLYAAAGGCVPVHVEGAGVVGTITVSGLRQVEDHQLVVQAIRDFLASA